jgi:hypothetical protein
MLYRRTTRPTLQIRTIPHEASPSCSSTFYDSESDEELDSKAKMASDYMSATRPLTVAIPKNCAVGPHCPRRPGLSEILANTASPPWTLSAFMAYLSQNHCLETLEFTMDASRYRKHYTKMTNRHPGTPISPKSEECKYVNMLWKRLLDAYIAPNGAREVNLPADVRDSLLSLSDPYLPPHPSMLDTAVAKVYELMEESVLVPFLNSVSPQTAVPDSAIEEYAMQVSSPQQSYSRTVPHSASVPLSSQHRASAPASYSRSLGPTSSHSRFGSGPARYMTSSSYGSSGSDVLTDDSGSVSSPSADPMTPPTTPPMGEYGNGGGWAAGVYSANGYATAASSNTYNHTSAGGATSSSSSAANSPKTSRAEYSGLATATATQWKKVSHKLGWRKKSSGHLREDELAGHMEE